MKSEYITEKQLCQKWCIFWWRKGYPPSILGLPGGSDGEEFTGNLEDLGSISGLGRSPGEEKGYPLQYSCLENSMGRGAWWGRQSKGSQRVGHHRVSKHKHKPSWSMIYATPGIWMRPMKTWMIFFLILGPQLGVMKALRKQAVQECFILELKSYFYYWLLTE